MSTISPRDINEFRYFISLHKSEIENKFYSIAIKSEWLKSLNEEEMFLLAQSGTEESKLLLAGDQNILSTVSEELAKGSPNVLTVLARNPRTPGTVLDRLAKSQSRKGYSGEDWKAIASNLNIAPETLELLSRAEDPGVRQIVAKNPNTPINSLDNLSKDNDGWTRVNVARNPNTTKKILEILSRDTLVVVRAGVAGNFNTPITILEILSRDQELRVRWFAMENPNTPKNLFQRQDFKELVKKGRYFLSANMDYYSGQIWLAVLKVLKKQWVELGNRNSERLYKEISHFFGKANGKFLDFRAQEWLKKIKPEEVKFFCQLLEYLAEQYHPSNFITNLKDNPWSLVGALYDCG
jgi:hypothetical protein